MDVETVREYRDGKDHFQKIIIHHMPIIDNIIGRYTSSHYRYEDVQEVAYFELVNAVVQARSKLKDNNITPYIIRSVTLNVLTFVIYDHLPIYPKRPTSRLKELAKRVNFDDVSDVTSEPLDMLALLEQLEVAVKDDEQREIVNLKIQGYSFKEIANRLPTLSYHHIRRRWLAFVSALDHENTNF